ncbi:Splicing factor, arginine/serine-rich 19 SR-related and CTD-associated factor 1 [Larimichthys crocea]|uniref:Splicing factor, arginine/serine-rich 19 SR-related and CTD-associated factor 1 n=1 Tax=Larimichthys crocea TaxID=215358 RepID=A0A6G0HWR3_LARCR|nr:Splicing factor, arginine/serine-rich 19 SR-related and CTD-associated factor 1 [Larimichthys crocea]
MDLTPASGFKRRPAASSSPSGVREIARSPPPRSPSLSLSSPSSDPSSPLSPSSSVCANLSVYENHVKSQTHRTEVARVPSTSASLATQPLSTPTSNTTTSDSFPHTSVQPSVECEEECGKREMYDPFHPTEGVKGEEGEGEKYDPFDPTGSPASDSDDRSGKVRGVKRNAERGDEEEKEEEPPDSTDTLTDLPSPGLATQLPLRRRVDCSTSKAGEQRDNADSDHSEIEEGEIVGAADRDGSNKRPAGDILPLNSPSISFFGSKPERILRVLDGDGFVSVRTEGNWEVDGEPEDEPVVGVEDLRRKLVSRRKERYLSFPASSPLSPQPPPPPSHPPTSTPSSPLTPPVEQGSKNCKSSKSSKDRDQQKSKDRKAVEKEERRKKRRKDKEGGQERSKEKERGHKEVKGTRSSRSSSRKMKKKRHSSPEASRSCNSSGRGGHTRHSLSSLSEERQRERDRDRDRDRVRDRDRDEDRDRDRGREREQNRTNSHRRDERDRDSSSQKKERERKGRQHSSSRERCISKGSKRSREKREGDRDRQRDRERRRDGRPVVPPSIQDLNGSDLFAIKRTITVTTTTTTTTVPGSPRLASTSPCRPMQESDKPHKRKKKRKWHSAGEVEDRGSCHSRSQSLSPPRYHSYESDHYSDKLEIDVLSLDGEALDSDYPSLEDTPPAALPPEPPVPSPKTKTTPKTGRHHPKKKSRGLKKIGQSELSTSSNRTKNKCLSSLTVTSGSASISSGLPSAKRARKMGKDKEREKGSRKDLGRSGKSKKESSASRKGKLQSKVSVLVREGVTSTTGASVGSGKLGMDLLGSGGTGGGAGGSVVGGSIAVVFCRDNESRSPFLKPCSEPLSLGSRSKDLTSMGKRSSLAAPPSSLTSPAGLKSKKTKPSSITSTSSSASSSSSSLATKRRRRLAKKTREKGGGGLTAGDSSQSKAMSEGWGGASLDVQSAVGDGSKSVSPHTGQAGPAPCSSSSSSSSSSSTSVLPPSSSPPHTPPPSMAPLRDTRESSPDSQTVDSSCKTPDPSFLAEDCPTQTSPTLPASSPSSLSTPQGAGLSITLSTPTAKPPPPDDAPKSLASPPCSSSSAGCGLTSLSLPLSSSDPSSSSSVSSSSASKPPPPPPPPPAAAPTLPWSLQTGVDCTTGGVLALTALLFKMEEANIASRAKAQEFIQATSQILSQANQSQSQQHAPPSSASSSSSSSQIPPPPALPPPPGLSPAQFILHSSLPLVGCTKTPPSLLHPSIGGGCAQTPPPIVPVVLSGVTGSSGDTGWDNESKDPDKYLKKLHTQERAVEEVKLAIKPYYQRKDINKDEYKDILRKAVHKICHSRTGEINPVKVSNLVKLYVQRYKYFRKHGRKMDEEERDDREPGALHSSA